MKKIVIKAVCVMLVVSLIAGSTSAFAMTDGQRVACHALIHSAAAAAASSSALLAQAPGSDNVPLVLILGGMTVGLCVTFDVPMSKTQELAVGMDVVAAFSNWITAYLCSEWLVGWIPLSGNCLNATLITGLVEMIGWEIADMLDTGNVGFMSGFLASLSIAKEGLAHGGKVLEALGNLVPSF